MADFEGQFLWYDLLTSDIENAKAFYTDIVGWGAQIWEESKETYTMWTLDKQPIGGIMLLPEQAKQQGAPPHWMGYIGTSDVTTTLNKAKDLGAQIFVPPTNIPEVGTFAVMADPQGAVIAVYTPSTQAPDLGGEPKPGRIIWHELLTIDQEAAWDFYQQLFGWEQTDVMDMGAMGSYRIYGKDGRTLGGIMTKPKEMPGASMWIYYITVQDINTAIDKVKSHKGKVLNGPTEVPGGGQVAQCMDPQGAMFALHANTKI